MYLCLPCKQFVEVGIGFGKGGIYLFELGEQSHSVGNSLAYYFDDSLVVVELRLLLEISDRVAGGENDLTIEAFVDSCNDFEQGRLTRTVQPDDTDFGTIEK